MLVTANICFSAHAYHNPEVTVWSRIGSENRRTVLISMHGASFSSTAYMYIVFIYGIPARRIEVCTEQPGFDTSARRIEACTKQPGLIRMLGTAMYAQSNPVLIHMLGASKYAHSNHFWTSNIISICRCEHAHKSQCMLFRACSSHPLLV